MVEKPKILFFDLETTPNEGTFWGLRVFGYLSPENITRERTIICASWKWNDSPEVHSVSVTAARPNDDKGVVTALYDVMCQADAAIAHNGDKFDFPWIRTRMVYHGLPALPPVIQIDTRKIAKKYFNFNSNKLSYLVEFFKIGKKIKTDYDLWKACLAGDVKALAKMLRYNRRDVVLLPKVYKKLSPYVPARINAQLFGDGRLNCKQCGSPRVQRRGFAYTVAHKYPKYQCSKCGHWYRDTKAVKQ
jgi:uncharacterized protein YprB with RNaseH-like and TPR domain